MTSSEQRVQLLEYDYGVAVRNSEYALRLRMWCPVFAGAEERARMALRNAVILHEANTWHDAGGAGGEHGL